MSHIYTVALPEGRTIMHVEADTKNQARSFALQGVTVERLTGSEAIALTRRGIAIVSAETGKVCNADEPLPLANPVSQSTGD